MIDKKNRELLTSSSIEYIIGDRLKNLPEVIKSQLIDKSNHKALNSKISKDNFSYTEIEYQDRRIICTYSSKRAKKDTYNRQKLIDKTQKWIKNPSQYKQVTKRGAGRFICKDEEGSVSINTEQINNDAKYDGFTPVGIAKALYYPRVLGTSINTSFGTRIQNMFVELGLANGSLIKGLDIEFQDKIDNRKKWCQLKSGPNTINSEDVNPLLKKFSTVANLARTNQINLNNSDLILGVLYGQENQLSQHYKRIDEKHPVIIGAEF
jgi:hypothetical protein